MQLYANLFFQEPLDALRLLTLYGDPTSPEAFDLIRRSNFGRYSHEYIVVQVGMIANLLGLGSYFGATAIYSLISFVGLWKLFLVFRRQYPALEKEMAFATLFIPSVVFWGSGILKDTLTIGMLGFLIYAIDQYFFRKKKNLRVLITILTSGGLIFYAKPYILIAITPAIIIWVVYGYKDRIKISLIRFMFVPFLIGLIFGATYFVLNLTSKYIPKYALENLLISAQTMQNWHYVEGKNTSAAHGRGSSYSLGSYDPSLNGVLTKFFPAVNVTLYRPYPWEAHNIAMMGAAIESMLVLIISIYLVLGIGIFRFFRLLNSDPFLLMCFMFSLLFAFAVGFSAYNFGALARYKIPCMPFYIAALFILRSNQGRKKIHAA
jgi:4-amino-4-deoxy-L-arabinose transferase-like glycosyltransferase